MLWITLANRQNLAKHSLNKTRHFLKQVNPSLKQVNKQEFKHISGYSSNRLHKMLTFRQINEAESFGCCTDATKVWNV